MHISLNRSSCGLCLSNDGSLGKPAPLTLYSRSQGMQVIAMNTVELVHNAGVIGAPKDMVCEGQSDMFVCKESLRERRHGGRGAAQYACENERVLLS